MIPANTYVQLDVLQSVLVLATVDVYILGNVITAQIHVKVLVL